MTALLEGTFFSDKVRGAITLFLLLIIVGVLGFQYLFPRPQPLDKEALASLMAATEVMQKAANNLEHSSQSQIELNDTLKQQLSQMALARNEGYEQLLKKYGLDLTLPGSVNLKLDGLDGRVFPPDNDFGGNFVPPVPSATGSNKQLQKPAPGHQSQVDPSDPLSAKQEPAVTGLAFERTHSLFDGKRLHCTRWGSPSSVLSDYAC